MRDEIRFQRAVQLYDWAMPAVSLEAMRLACQDSFGGGATTMTSWRRIGPETLAVTSNPDVSYAFAWLDLAADGPNRDRRRPTPARPGRRRLATADHRHRRRRARCRRRWKVFDRPARPPRPRTGGVFPVPVPHPPGVPPWASSRAGRSNPTGHFRRSWTPRPRSARSTPPPSRSTPTSTSGSGPTDGGPAT